jgi:hypothetical protein
MLGYRDDCHAFAGIEEGSLEPWTVMIKFRFAGSGVDRTPRIVNIPGLIPRGLPLRRKLRLSGPGGWRGRGGAARASCGRRAPATNAPSPGGRVRSRTAPCRMVAGCGDQESVSEGLLGGDGVPHAAWLWMGVRAAVAQATTTSGLEVVTVKFGWGLGRRPPG